MAPIRCLFIAVLGALVAGSAGSAWAQTTATQTQVPQQVTTINQGAGVVVDAKGVLRTEFFNDQTGQLARQRITAAKAAMNPQLASYSQLRKVSLNRLEAALKKQLDDGQQPSDEIKNLAGLQRIEYVFYYPDTRDIVIAGPAEGWIADQSGRVRGITTAKPVVQLEDLVTALRAFAPGSSGASVIGCSIDPTKEGEQRLHDFLRSVGSVNPRGDSESITTGIKSSLGLHTVKISGVPGTTHFAQILVEADYRMKLIGLGLERPPLKQFASYYDRVNPTTVARNAMQRWWFVPDYQCVRVAPDGLAMELVGNGVKLLGADELVNADGSRITSSAVNKASQAFTEMFTKRYAELAAVSPIYGQLRNCIDLAVAAAFIQQQKFYDKADWRLGVLGDEKVYQVETLTTPQQVKTAVNPMMKSGRIVGAPLGGGVVIHPYMAIESSNVLPDDEGKVEQARKEVDLSKLAEGQWWWD